ncbi:MAG: hypothetical protein JOZ69_17335 [Myxococcales bacterium]|nr:hypothetical protein [Myxococcales bacterium]
MGATWARPGAFVAGGIAVAGLATFAAFGLMARSTYDDLNGACAGGPCPASKSDEISSGRMQQTVANIGLAVGIVGAGGAAILFLLPTSRPARSAGAVITVAPGWIGVRGPL